MTNKDTRQMMSVDKLIPDPKQPRKTFDPVEMARLIESITAEGIISPLVIEEYENGKFLILDGERRWRASKKIGSKEVPVVVEPKMSDLQRVIRRFHVQETHSNWSAYDKAHAVSTLAQTTGWKSKEISEALNMSKATIDGYLAISSMQKELLNLASEKKVPHGYITIIASMSRQLDKKKRPEFEKRMVERCIDGEFINTHELSKLGFAMRENVFGVAKKIVGKNIYTAKQAMKDTGADIRFAVKAAKGHSGHVITLIKRVLVFADARRAKIDPDEFAAIRAHIQKAYGLSKQL